MTDDRPLIAWSHSALEVFRTCPRKYYESKISKAWVEEFKGPAAEWGTAVHKALEQRVKYGSPLPPNMVQWEPLAKKLAGMRGVIHTEMQLALDRNLNMVSWFAKNVWVRVIIDLACVRRSSGKAIMWDYKTGKQKDDDRQLALGAAVLFELYPDIHTITSGYIWLKEHTVTKATFVREHKDRLWNQYLPTVELLEQAVTSGQWPEKPSGLCSGWCPVEDCKFWAPKKEK